MNSTNGSLLSVLLTPTVTSSPSSEDPMISLTVPAAMFATGVFGNVLALVVLARSSRETKKRVFYRLVGALAITDLIGICATSPVTLAIYANNLKWLGGMPLCNYESFMLIFAGCSTISIISTMAVDRFVSIGYPFAYDKHVTSRKTKLGILTLWGFSLVMGLLPVVGFGENVVQFPGTWCFFTFTSSKLRNKIYSYMYTSIGLLSIIVTAVSNTLVTIVLLKMKHRSGRFPAAVCYACHRRYSKETQMLILMIGITAIFTTCWGPFLIRLIINQANEHQVDLKADLLALRLASLNQILDPWVYILFRQALFTRLQATAREIITKCFKGKEESFHLKQLSSKRKFDFSSENVAFSSENQETIRHSGSVADDTSAPPSRRPSKKYLKRTRSSVMAAQLRLINDHAQNCVGLKHVQCLHCFTSLPQHFALILGTNVMAVANGGTDVQDLIETVLETSDTNVNESRVNQNKHIEIVENNDHL